MGWCDQLHLSFSTITIEKSEWSESQNDQKSHNDQESQNEQESKNDQESQNNQEIWKDRKDRCVNTLA